MDGTNNFAQLCGTLAERPIFSHTGGGEDYFAFPLEIERLSGFTDRINIIARESQLASLEIEPLPRMYVAGELRSYNNKHGPGSRLVITALARELRLTAEEDMNFVTLSGVICKPTTLRRTPMGRQICDIMLAVNRRYGRSDYLPCIAWGRLAETASGLSVGNALSLEGRIQSRKYIKTEDGVVSERTAFEVSVVNFVDPE